MLNYAGVTTIYVSQRNGSNTHMGIHHENDALMNGPVKTIEQALSIVSTMRHAGYEQHVTVALMDEEYILDRTLEINYPKGEFYRGSMAVSNITFAPYGHERALISGGKRIEGWAKDTFMGKECLSVFLPEVKEGKWSFTDFFVNGDYAKKTRMPETGFYTPEAVELESDGLRDGSHWFVAKEGDIPARGYRLEDATISFCRLWVDEHSRIAAYDPATRKLTFDGVTGYHISAKPEMRQFLEYYIENLAEAFKNPGEWYLDRPNGMLYYIPKAGETAENIVAHAPVLNKLLTVSGDLEKEKTLHGIHFKRIAFAYSKSEFDYYVTKKDENGVEYTERCMNLGQSAAALPSAVTMTAVADCSIEECAFYCLGYHAISFEKGCRDCAVVKTRIQSCGAGGIYLRGGNETEPPFTHNHHNLVSDCKITGLGRVHVAGAGIFQRYGSHSTFCHNEISDLYYTGISTGWRWGYGSHPEHDNRIYKNHVHHVGKGILSDLAGIYLLGGQTGTIVEGNVIHDVAGHTYGGQGIYTDEGCSYVLIRNNICYDCSSESYQNHYGAMNVVTNNIFAFGRGFGQVFLTRREAHISVLFEKNIFVTSENIPVYFEATPGDFHSDRNLFYCIDGGKASVYADNPNFMTAPDAKEHELALAEYRRIFHNDEHSIEANPRFKNLAARDFTLRADSPAFKLGFEPIDTSDVGPRSK